MSRIHRTPPGDNINKTLSESSIPDALNQNETLFVNTNRNKRARVDLSPTNDFQQFKSEIKEMIHSWKEEQETSLTKMISEQTTLMRSLLNDLTEVKMQNSEIKQTNAEIMNSVGFMNEKFEEIKSEMDILKKERNQQSIYIQSLEKKLNDLQHKSRTSSLEIRNVPFNDKETVTDLQELVCRIGKLSNVSINHSEIRDVYRTGSRQNSTRPIVAELTTVQKKHTLLSSVREYNKSKKQNVDKINTESIGISGKPQPIYISEHLPMTSKKLFHSAREFAKEYNYKFCWCVNGNIFLRKKEGDKQTLVTSEQSLKDLNLNVH